MKLQNKTRKIIRRREYYRMYVRIYSILSVHYPTKFITSGCEAEKRFPSVQEPITIAEADYSSSLSRLKDCVLEEKLELFFCIFWNLIFASKRWLWGSVTRERKDNGVRKFDAWVRWSWDTTLTPPSLQMIKYFVCSTTHNSEVSYKNTLVQQVSSREWAHWQISLTSVFSSVSNLFMSM